MKVYSIKFPSQVYCDFFSYFYFIGFLYSNPPN